MQPMALKRFKVHCYSLQKAYEISDKTKGSPGDFQGVPDFQ